MPWQCTRCGQQWGDPDSRWCARCGLDSKPTAATLPTAEAMEAGMRERAWFDENPDEERRENERHDVVERERARQRDREERARLATMRPPEFDGYRDLEWRARLARGWLFIAVGFTLVGALCEIAHISLLFDISRAEYAFGDSVDDSNARIALAYLVTLCAFVLSAATFILWTWRAYRNAPALGAKDLRYRAGWAIGGWFVPILGLWRPKQIVNDIWRTSEPGGGAIVRQSDWSARAIPDWLTTWWVLFIVSSMLDNISSRLNGRAITMAEERTATIWALAGSIATIVAGLLATHVVKRISQRQRERAEMLSKLPARPAPAPPPPPAPVPEAVA